MEHPSEKARTDYLKEHPNADPSNHTVAKDTEDEEIPVTFEEDEKPAKGSLWNKVKGLGAKAKKFLESAPKETQRFFTDDAFRRTTLMAVHDQLEKAPAALVSKVVETARHEVKEFKEAGAGVKAVLTGGKMSDHQKKAFKTVGTHMAIGLAAAALTASGPLAVGGTFVKGLARHIAAKAVSNAMGHLHVLDELGHIGHGVKHILEHLASTQYPDTQYYQEALQRYAAEKKKAPRDLNPDEVMANFMAAAVAKEIKNLKDSDIEAGFHEDVGSDKTAGLSSRIVVRYLFTRVR